MATHDSWVFESVLDNKRFIKSQQNLERSMKRFEKRVQQLKATTAQQEVKHTQTVTAAHTRSEQAKRKQAGLTADKAERERLKQEVKQRKFNDWQVRQYRSAAFQKLSIEQQMNLKRILSAKKSEAEIRDEYAATTAMYRREMAQRKAYEKKQRSVVTGVSGAARGGAMGGLAGGAMALASNPVALGAAATVGAGGMLINAGADNVTQTRRAADDAGVDFQTFDRRSFVDSNVSGMSVDKIGQLYQDVNDKVGDFKANVEVDKDGNFDGGGELTDVANLLKRETGASNADVLKMFEGNSIEVADKVSEALKDSDIQTRTFALESLSSDLIKLQQARSNTDRVAAAQQQFDAMNLGFSDDDLQKINEVSVVMDGFFSVLSRAPTEAFKSFASNLSPQTMEMLGNLGELIVNVAGIIGDVLAGALNLLSPAINFLLNLLNPLIKGIKAVTGWIADWTSLFDTANPIFNAISATLQKLFGIDLLDSFSGWVDDFSNGLSIVFDFLKNAIKGWIADLINVLPDWIVPDSAKKWAAGGDNMDSAKNKQKQEDTRKTQQTAQAAGVSNTHVQSSIAYHNFKTNSYNNEYSYNSAYNKNESNYSNQTIDNSKSNYNTQAPAVVEVAQRQLPRVEQTNGYTQRAQAAQQAQQLAVQNSTNVKLELDGEVIAQQVVETQSFNEQQQRAMYRQNMGNY